MRLKPSGTALVLAAMLLAPFTSARPVLAQPAGTAAPPHDPPVATTMLHLAATATVEAPPDRLVGDLVAQASSRSAAAAQRAVDTLIAAGMKQASAVPGVDARAIGYAVEPADSGESGDQRAGDRQPGWTARQTIELSGGDGPSLLDLVGRLQDRGFVTASLDWQLSDAARRKADDDATLQALARLQQRAAQAAAALGLRVDHLQDVRLDDAPDFRPLRAGPAMMMAARVAAPPQATAAPQAVSASASADIVLRPR